MVVDDAVGGTQTVATGEIYTLRAAFNLLYHWWDKHLYRPVHYSRDLHTYSGVRTYAY